MPIISLLDVEDRLRGVGSVALGGMLLENRPSTLVRALIRSGARDLFLCSAPAASWDADVLIGAGLVSRVRIPHISMAGLGLAPHVRGAAEDGSVVFEDCDEAMLLGGYLAASNNAWFQVLDNLGTNDLVDDNPLRVTAGGLVGVAPLRIDVALLHAPLGDEKGNLVHFGSRWADVLMARSARHVIAQVDRVVSTAEAARLGVSIPGYLIDDVVETPFGAHPLGSVGSYAADLEHLADYQAQVKAGGFADYLAQRCHVDHDAYVAGLPAARLRELEMAGC
ncbi:CoA transferase subunit A [Streptomyces sp. NPDC056723]|uniref:CoA transferase subunit A n=1 Tax=Streptomyces sp. NPDC056723 TaxID=3345925 RepID=UPI003696A9B1